MEMIITKSDWGIEHLGDLPERMKIIADAGFDGIECFFVDIPADQFLQAREQTQLDFVSGFVAPNIESFRSELLRRLPYQPRLINCHGGRDYFSFDEGVEFFHTCIEIAKEETDIQVVFETHRRCTLYSPWGTQRYLEEIPGLRICADFSHFTVVSEGNMKTSVSGMPDDEGMMAIIDDPAKKAMMDIAIDHADHIHSRIGDLHRPQTADPRIGEGYEWTELYEQWWDQIIEKRLHEGREFLTICPEFGPPPYAPVDPNTGIPHADPWDVSIWNMQRFHQRWEGRL